MTSQTTARPAGDGISASAIEALQARLTGELLQPIDAGYEAARRVFNAMIDRRPALIARCAGTPDIVECVTFARDRGLPISIRGGGHSVAGSAVCEGGLMLDLSGLKGAHVDPVHRVARAQPGLTLGELDAATQAFGLATPLGVVSMTGIAGLTLGGGLGWLSGKFGLACDNLLAAEVVTADGRVVTASADTYPDLYWAIRGGGGNFGVVSEFTYRLHPVGPVVLAGTLTYPPRHAREALRYVRELASDPLWCPDELSLSVSLGTDPHLRPAVSVTFCFCGPIELGQELLLPMRAFCPAGSDTIEPVPYVEFQRASDAGFPRGRHHYWKSSYLKELSDGAIDVLFEFLAANPTPSTSGIGLQHMHGAASRVDPRATAFPHRDRQYDFLILSQSADPTEFEQNVAWTRGLFEAMQPFLKRSVYANNLGDEGEDRVKAAYGVNYDRLAAVKRTYDPHNVFRLNHNIRPAAGSGDSSHARL